MAIREDALCTHITACTRLSGIKEQELESNQRLTNITLFDINDFAP